MLDVGASAATPGGQELNLLVDIGGLGRGGAERQVVQLTKALKARGHGCLVAANYRVSGYEDDLTAAGIGVAWMNQKGAFDATVLARLIGLVRVTQPDVCLCVGFSSTLWGRAAALLAGVPVVTAEHATPSTFPLERRLTNRLLGPRTKAVVACAREQVPSVVAAGNPVNKVRVIANGVNADAYYYDSRGRDVVRRHFGIPASAFVVGLVAGHRPVKRHDRFIRVMETLRAHDVDVWGCMVGGGELLDFNRGQAMASAVSSRVVVMGSRLDMRAVYSAMDVVVLVSDSETFPYCLLEAQACARPVVVMEAGGVGSTLVHGSTGFVVPQGDCDEMAATLKYLSDHPEVATSMGASARSWIADSLSEDLMVDEYESLLLGVVEGRLK